MATYRYPAVRQNRSGIAVGLLAVIWFAVAKEIAARSATGFAGQFQGGLLVPLLQPLFLLFLLLLGFVLLDRLKGRRSTVRDLLALPQRPTARSEWGLGAAIGWGVTILAVLPLVLVRGLRLQFWAEPRAWLMLLIALAGALASTLAVELTFRGYGFRSVRENLGPAWSTLLLSLLYAVLIGFGAGGLRSMAVAFTLGVLLACGWLRTHALWLPWGLHFAWNGALGALFGLPVLDGGDLSSVVQAQVFGHHRVTGFGLGPIGGVWTPLLLLLAVGALVRLTRDFAWSYTHPVITPGGYAVDVPPPAAHQAATAPPPPPLVQILPSSPVGRSRPEPPPRPE